MDKIPNKCPFVGMSVCLSVCNFNVANNFVTFASTHFIFDMHVYLIETFNLIPNMPRSGVKVKGHINVSNSAYFRKTSLFFVLFPSRHFILGMHVYLMDIYNLIP